MTVIWITLLLFISSSHTIQTRSHRPRILRDQQATSSRNYRHIVPLASPDFDWKHGLREATIQGLLRERLPDYHLRERIFFAPFLGKPDKASPFGDIALIARGQLYANYAGYIFVQDPHQNDCDECHNIEQQGLRERCVFNHCQIWHARNDNQLLALWSIKRIRHRSLKEGHSKLELEYKIAPIGWSYSREKYLTREGAFNYDIPGHVFILKNVDSHQNQFNGPQIDYFKHGVFVAQAPDGRKYILHNFPGAVFTPETPRFQTSTSGDSMLASTTASEQYTEEDPKKLYQDLLEALHKKTSLTPHRFSLPSTNIPTITASQTTLMVQLPTGQIIPITKPINPTNTPGYVPIRFPETSPAPTKQTTLANHPIIQPPENPDVFRPTSPQVQKTSTQLYMTQGKISMPFLPTTSIFAPSVSYPQSTSGSTFIGPQYSDMQQTKFTPQYTTAYVAPTTQKEVLYQKPEDNVNTTLPVKTTYHFFAAEEESSTASANAHLTSVLLHTTPTYSATKETTGHHLTTHTDFGASSFRMPGNVVKVTTSARVFPTTSKESVMPTKQTSAVPSTLFEPSTAYYTTKPPPTHFTHPMMVLQDSSEDNIVTGPSTRKDATTLFQTSTTVASEEETNTATESKISSTLTSPVTSQAIPSSEMTMIINMTIMHPGPKTTQAVYFASEDSSETHPTIGKDTAIPFNMSTITKIPTTQATKTESTPKRIITNIGADGKVSVKTTPINAQFELFGATSMFSRKPKPTQSLRASSTEPSNFLVEEGLQKYKLHLYKNSVKDYSKDEIFGPTKSTLAHLPRTTKKYTMSDLEEALFDGNGRKSKVLRNPPFTTTETSNVVFSNYFDASTTAMTSEPPTTVATEFHKASVAEKVRGKKIFNSRLPKVNLDYKKNEKNMVEHNMPVTSQSYLTSISYEVNKGKVKKVVKNNSYEELTTEYSLESEKNSDPIKSEKRSDEASIDNFALRLVGQAKSVQYLENTLTTTTVTSTSNKNEKPSKKLKYTRRRSYIPRSKRPVKKALNIISPT